MKKSVILFSLIGVFLFGSGVGVYAGSNSKMLEVFFNIKDIKINQVSKMPKEEPFTYKGTTYVPLRYISEQLGNPVNWDSTNKTINIGKTNELNAIYPGRDMEHMNFQRRAAYPENDYDYSFNDTPISDSIGNEYSNYVMLSITTNTGGEWSLIEFPLNGKYSTFKATLGLTNKTKSTSSEANLEVYLDGKLKESYPISAGNMPENIKVDVKHANKITFKLIREDGGTTAEAGLFDARFYK
jgi:hypothetical protein